MWRLHKYIKSVSGNVALLGSLLTPVLLGLGALATDYTLVYNQQSHLQQAADSAVLAGARELGIAGTDDEEIAEIVATYVRGNFATSTGTQQNPQDMKIIPVIGNDRGSLTVDIEYYWKPFLAHLLDNSVMPIKVTAKAGLAGSENICLMALETSQAESIRLGQSSGVNAEHCVIHTNSSSSSALAAMSSSRMLASKSCTAGGYSGGADRYSPTPIVDCPRIDDPLRDRSLPGAGIGCDYSNYRVYEKVTRRLRPGKYCGGIIALGEAHLKLDPGTYTILDGDVDIGDGATISGTGVTLHFARNSRLYFRNASEIAIVAPKTGATAGIVISSSKSNDPSLVFEIESRNARELTGLIYLPENTLKLGDDLNDDGICDPENDEYRQFGYKPSEINSLKDPHIHYHQHADGTIHRHPHANTFGKVSPSLYRLIDGAPPYRLHHQEDLFHGHPEPISDCKTYIGHFSDWTAIIARNILVSARVELVLNADYANSPIPNPILAGTGATAVRLTE